MLLYSQIENRTTTADRPRKAPEKGKNKMKNFYNLILIVAAFIVAAAVAALANLLYIIDSANRNPANAGIVAAAAVAAAIIAAAVAFSVVRADRKGG